MGIENMKLEDLYRMYDNKRNWHNATTQTQKDVSNLNNTNILASYGLTQNDNVSIGELGQYIAAAEKQQASENQKNTLLTNLTQKATNGDARVQKSADAVRNFKYDPSTDPAYQSYVDMYNRQGQSAAKSTLNNLNSASMGRTNSFSAAATAQVQQAYAQKASEMIPTLAEQAYNKLLQQYKIDKDMSDTQYNRELTAYQTLAEAGTRELTDEGQRLSNEQARIYGKYYPTLLEQEAKTGELNYDQSLWNFEQDKKYAPTEREQNIKMNDVNIQTGEITRDNLQRQYDDEHKANEANLQNIYSTINNRSSGSSSGSYSSGSSKEMNKRNTDSYISSYLYSDALNPDGSGIWQGTSSHPQYYAVDKLNNADIVASIVDSLIEAGYTYAQAKDKIEEYKTNVTIETMKIEGKQGWDDEDVVKARKNVLFG